MPSSIHAAGPATDDLAAGAPHYTADGGDWDAVITKIGRASCRERV